MTDREKLIDVFMHLDRHIENRDEYGICYTSDFVKAVETVLQMLKNGADEREWIPVTERLPIQGEDVLAWAAPFVSKAWRNEKGDWVTTHGPAASLKPVTHWMPLPKPPEDGGAENG